MTTPTAAKSLVKKLGGWSSEVVHGAGTCEFGHLEWTGAKRHRVKVTENVESVSVRASHYDGRRFWAVWIRREGQKGWSFDDAWRFRHAGDLTPVRLTARQVNAYAAAPDLFSALAAERAAAPKSERERERVAA